MEPDNAPNSKLKAAGVGGWVDRLNQRFPLIHFMVEKVQDEILKCLLKHARVWTNERLEGGWCL